MSVHVSADIPKLMLDILQLARFGFVQLEATFGHCHVSNIMSRVNAFACRIKYSSYGVSLQYLKCRRKIVAY